MTTLALIALVLALIPAALAAGNLLALRAPRPAAGDDLVSILIPARNEAANLPETLGAALASRGVPIEVIVANDHSTDDTPGIVAALAARDPRLRLIAVPPLPQGWTGKNHACHVLAQAARGRHLLFIDADVRLGPDAAAALAVAAGRRGTALLSGVPRQITGSLGEGLTVPMINLLLLGYLPIPLARRVPHPALGAACGQLVLIEGEAYRATGGHAAVRASLHDGVQLPRLFRRAGLRTDLVDGAPLAACRMYASFGQAWAGFSKNAHEGMATPRALPVWTLLLFGGHLLPWLLVLAGETAGLPALLATMATRAAVTVKAREAWWTIPLHPLAVATTLALQWNALLRPRQAGAATWKGRTYPVA
ncbi:glycosyltransferase [Methylobacterium isbiliense]|uniref:4,4'-diaponeurosporenoate glycosyltransferase n=1 Tax=Methylobacterium isbiliense TaxID=315478 RepID=A0ABQ4SIN9_9HYPH|nr:glycosyltransferase family 2 protein [Methylobacterium isbiliense]MDN3626369.1 glycosyltransferase family 2 protein [Methylobacterium isbiliense]GJE03042.1 4,4'-diaponeurosporenoate glycosyltransferase [Methylobacterium isbiliense]